MEDEITVAAPSEAPAGGARPASASRGLAEPITSDDIRTERDQNKAPRDKFAFSPDILHRLIENRNPLSINAFGGLDGLTKGLQTDAKAGISVEEDVLDGRVSLEEVLKPGSGKKSRPTSTKHAPSTRNPRKFTDRRRFYGENRIPRPKPKTFLQLLWLAYNDKIMFLLTASATISLALGIYETVTDNEGGPGIQWVEGVAILIAVIVIVLATAINDWQKNYRFQKLNRKREERTVTVTRSGKHRAVSIFDVLVGDVLNIKPGDVIPADGILIEGLGIQCDESSLTGESDLVGKSSAYEISDQQFDGPFLLSGTKVVTGVGSYLVLAVGVNSSHGKITVSLQGDVQETPLQRKLGWIAGKIIKFGLIAGFIAFIVQFTRYLVELHKIEGGAQEKGQEFLKVLILSITIIVIAVPEGLPLTVTLALAFATTRMLKDKNLVRLLRSCETMGNATTICSDKTGTLTQNKMSVVAGMLGTSDEFADDVLATSLQHEDNDQPLPGVNKFIASLSDDVKELLKMSFALNSTAIEMDGPDEFIGSNTETALLKFGLAHLGMGAVSQEREDGHIAQMIPFDATRKWMAVIVKLGSGHYRMLIKGAGEVILSKCSESVQDPANGLASGELSQENTLKLNNRILKYAGKSLRVVALAYKDFDHWPEQAQGASTDLTKFSDLNFIGAFGIRDPLRPEVVESVKLCQHAGVFVRMVTGDNLFTGTAIAEESGIYTAGGIAMDGQTFRKLSSAQLDLVAPRLQVLARCTPEDKMRLVSHLKGLDEVVAVTGDGTNDALALKAADVGFAMGISGTEVAKEASAIVLLDDNFASIAKAVGWGRAVNEAAKKFLQFQFTINISAGALTVISAFVGGPDASVFSVVQLLWINLIMDAWAALALSTDFPTPGLMRKKPDQKNDSILSTAMWKMILIQAIYQMAVIFTLHYAGASLFGYHTGPQLDQLQTMVFNIYVLMQFFNQTNCRRIDNKLNVFEGMSKNPWFFIVQIVTISGQMVIVFVGGAAFTTARLTGTQWAWSILFGFLTIPLGVIVRFIPDEWVYNIWLVFKYILPDRCLQRRPKMDEETGERKPNFAKRMAKSLTNKAKSKISSKESKTDTSSNDGSQDAVPLSQESQQAFSEPPLTDVEFTALIDAARHGQSNSESGLEIHPDTLKDDPVLFEIRGKIDLPPSQSPQVVNYTCN